MKYKVGDKVKVVEFKQLEKKFVTRRRFSNGRTFTPSMQKFCGKVVTIKFVESSWYAIHEDGGNWFWDDNMFESFPTQKIVITTDGVETLARLYEDGKVVKKATAKCSPDDTFDFNVGAKLAFERLMNEEKKPLTFREKLKQEHPEKTKSSYGGGCYGCPKDYGYESKPYCSNTTPDCTRCWDRAIPEDKAKKKEKDPPKYYNGKVVCVERGFEYSFPLPDITIGKVYTVTDGILVADDNYRSCKYKTLRELCGGLGHKFIPFVE